MAMMRLNDLMNAYRTVYGDFTSWDATLATMLEDPYERDTVELLASELQQRGGFRQPVTLGTYEDWSYSAGDEDDVLLGTYPAVLDGTHRVCAHLLTGMEDVFVVIKDEHSEPELVGDFTTDETDPTYSLIMTTYMEAPLPLLDWAPERVTALEDPDEREADLDIWEALMSLRISDSVWITSATGGSHRHDGMLEISVTWDAEAFHVLPEVITERVIQKLQRFGYDMTRVKTWTLLQDYADDTPRTVDAEKVLPQLTVFA